MSDFAILAPSITSYDHYDDPLYISTSDQPVLQLRDVFFALVAKNKEGFVDGTCKLPPKADKNSKEPWTEILERCSQVNTLDIYQLRKELGQIQQDSLPLVEYYSKLKRIWEDIDTLDPLPSCTCGAIDGCTCQMLKKILGRESGEKLIQFLMGLTDVYDSVKTHVLTKEPLPPLKKALSLLQNIERQKQLHTTSDFMTDTSAVIKEESHFALKKPRFSSDSGTAPTHGFRNTANNAEVVTHLDSSVQNDPLSEDDQPFPDKSQAQLSPTLVDGLVNTVMDRVLKAFSEKTTSSSLNFAGTIASCHTVFSASFVNNHAWIIDTGASDHMTSNEHLLSNVYSLPHPLFVGFLDGTAKAVYKVGVLLFFSSHHFA
ncbi:hypothetical protein RND81_13G082000 [Saponaria officinalis]|uniref:Retrotransposon gag domain-containing protein n=1 Tax=Saponaria officinalis TaxID=3572 RepID=A0AAW1GV60_SAPOF